MMETHYSGIIKGQFAGLLDGLGQVIIIQEPLGVGSGG